MIDLLRLRRSLSRLVLVGVGQADTDNGWAFLDGPLPEKLGRAPASEVRTGQLASLIGNRTYFNEAQPHQCVGQRVPMNRGLPPDVRKAIAVKSVLLGLSEGSVNAAVSRG